jgi:hypothetical protein
MRHDEALLMMTMMGGSSIANAPLSVDELNGAVVAETSPTTTEEDMLHPKTTTNDSPIPEDDANVQY